MLDDILEESWTYQEILNKGKQRERQKRIQEQHEVVLNLIKMRFPELDSFAQPRVEAINDADVLHDLLHKMFAVQTAEEARQAIMNARVEE